MKLIFGIILTLGFTQLAGCAFGTRYVELSYPPEDQVEISSTAPTPIAAGPRTHIVILGVIDARETRDRIGHIRNTYGTDTASILTEDNVAVWVHDAIAIELNGLGYQVLDRHSNSSNGHADRLVADVQKVYCDVYMVYDGEVSLQATLERTNQAPISAEYSAQVNSGLSWAGSAGAIGESLAQALQTAIQNMLHDLGFTDNE
jgi:hypothetical protein